MRGKIQAIIIELLFDVSRKSSRELGKKKKMVKIDAIRHEKRYLLKYLAEPN